jgi:phage tail-like protein
MAHELEIPALYVDAVLLDPTPTTPVIINRDPEPDEVQIPIDAAIALDITDLGTAGIDTAATQVFVAGVLAFSGGVFQPGFTGPRSNVSSPQPDTLRIIVDALAPFESLQEVPVRVVTQTVGGANQLDATWSFTCEDLTAPHVVGAQARELKRVRVSFDENVKQESALAPDDALNPALYAIERASAPAVEVSVVGVAPVTNASVDLLTDIELTPGALYRVTVSGVVDLFGNAVVAPSNMAEFTGFVPARPARRRLELYQLLPMLNRREDQTGDLRRFLLCLQEVTELVLADIDGFTDILDPDIAPEPFVDVMLLDLGNPFPFDLSLADKRRLLNVLVAVYREKGTGIGIKNAIRFFLGLEVEIQSYAGEALILGESLLGETWILGASGPFSAYAFDVVSPRALTAEERLRVRIVVDYMKPAHTHFRVVEPIIPEIIDHLELGLSELGETWLLH